MTTKFKQALEDMGKRWKPVSGWEKYYEVSICGTIRKIDTKENLGQWINGNGYPVVRLSKPRSINLVHRIVASAFLLNDLKKPQVNHIDNNPMNNDLSNLEWCTQGENVRHAMFQGRMRRNPMGERSRNAKFSEAEIKKIRREYSRGNVFCKQIAKRYNVHPTTIQRIVKIENYKPLLPILKIKGKKQ